MHTGEEAFPSTQGLLTQAAIRYSMVSFPLPVWVDSPFAKLQVDFFLGRRRLTMLGNFETIAKAAEQNPMDQLLYSMSEISSGATKSGTNQDRCKGATG